MPRAIGAPSGAQRAVAARLVEDGSEPDGTAGVMAGPRSAGTVLDDADRRIIALLTAHGRLDNRAIATEIGLTEATISSASPR